MITYYDENGKEGKKEFKLTIAKRVKTKDTDMSYVLVRSGLLYSPFLDSRLKSKDGWRLVQTSNENLETYLAFLKDKKECHYRMAQRQIN